ncbi:MAG: SusC/RagA family TonB-linked outer membrane protein [Bacteroidales bacterium]|nr:SusC/RagA family TonB-linked outer membrane protein [Bacteroidales bacterium]
MKTFTRLLWVSASLLLIPQISPALATDETEDEKTVDVAYGSLRAVEITGAVSTVSGDELLKAPFANVANALQGLLPGLVVVQPSGTPGDDEPTIRVRGTGSLNDAAPLILVDGVERPFSHLDPNEIESISVLKDGATAVYGMRGANGVILVTTRRGCAGKPSVTASVNAGMQSITRFPEFADSYKYGQLWNYAVISDNGRSPGTSRIADYRPYSDLNLRFSQEDMDDFGWGRQPSGDWTKYVMKNFAWQEQANVNVSGGADRVRYFVSVGFLNQDSMLKDFTPDRRGSYGYRRFNYRANLDVDIARYSQLSLTLGGSLQDRNNVGSSGDDSFRNLRAVTPFDYTDAPFYLSEPGGTNTNTLNMDLQYKLDMSFLTKGLDFRIKGSYNSDFGGLKGPDATDSDKWERHDWYAEAGINYARSFGKHNVGALLLYNQSRNYLPFTAGSEGPATKSYAGLVGRLAYNYADRYLIDFSIGYNGSDSFARGKRFGTFPSISLGWVPSNEEWWQPIKKWFSLLKFRGSWGMSGSDIAGGTRNVYLPDATWEKSRKINAGGEIGFFEDRLTASFDYFWEYRWDLLVSNASEITAIDPNPGTFINSGSMKNRGYEVTVSWKDKAGDFRYSITPSLSYARNAIVEMPRPFTYPDNLAAFAGQRIGYELFGLYRMGIEEDYMQQYGVPMPDQMVYLAPGDCVYVDLNGDGIIDEHDQRPLEGYAEIPQITYSLNVAMEWKGLDFSMLWTGAGNVNRTLGGYFRNQFGEDNLGGLTQWVADKSWTEDNTDASLPRISFANRTFNNRLSSVWIANSGYVRLRNLEIGYRFDMEKERAFFNYIRMYVSGQNLLTFSRFDANDPEAPSSEVDGGLRYPMTKVVNLGVQFNF